MRISVALTICAADARRRHSSGLSCPVSIFCDGTDASRARSLLTSCSRLISSENTATVLSEFFATSIAMFSAILVLPIAGRAAISISSPLFSPRMNLSRSLSPVESPGMVFPLDAASDILS